MSYSVVQNGKDIVVGGINACRTMAPDSSGSIPGTPGLSSGFRRVISGLATIANYQY